MAIVYCSWATGNDTTGDGTAANPYKTITKASTSRSPGDEVRVAKSPEPTALTGTVSFTFKSTAVTGVGTAFTSELAIGDFIKAPDGQYYEVITLTSDTEAVLYKRYPGETQSGYSSYKLGVTNTGAAASASGTVQSISSSGDSSASLYISGGWDLSTETQTGQTWFRQMHGTFANRYGMGLTGNTKTYLNLDKINFLRYYTGYYGSGSRTTIVNMTCNSNNVGLNIAGGSYHNIQNALCNSNGNTGLIFICSNSELTNVICNSNGGSGISARGASNVFAGIICNSNYANGLIFDTSNTYNIVQSATCLYNDNAGIEYYNTGSYNIIQSATCNFNKYGIYYYVKTTRNTIINATCNSNTSHGIIYDNECCSNIVINATCNLNGDSGICFNYYSCNNIINNIICNSNLRAVSFTYTSIYSNCSNNIFYKLSASGNTKVMYIAGFNNVFHTIVLVGDLLFDTVGVYYPESMVYINNINGYSYVLSKGAVVNSQDATAGGTGKEWKFSITSTPRNENNSFYIPIARAAVASSGQVIVTVYFKKSGTGIAGALRCRYGQVEWSDASEDIIVNCPDDTNRNQVTLQFTPTEAGVVEIEALAWYVSAVDQNIIIDDIEISQA